MAKAEKYLIPNMPATESMGEVTEYKRKQTPLYTYEKSGEFPVIAFTSEKGATVTIGFIPAVAGPVDEAGNPTEVPAQFVVNVDGVDFSTNEKHCPGKIKTVTRQAVNNLLRAIGKYTKKSERSAASIRKGENAAAAKKVLALL